MTVKHTAANASVWYPDNEGNVDKKIANSCELSAVKLSAGALPATVTLYDAVSLADCIYANAKWFLDASTTDDDNQSFPAPINFKKGIYAVLESGTGGAPRLSFAAITPGV